MGAQEFDWVRGTVAVMATTRWLMLLLWLLPSAAWAQSATTVGQLSSPHPTLENLSIVWEITGDDNNNGVVTVRYREISAPGWRVGLPLIRVPAGSSSGFSWTNKHSGSVFDLVPGTTYEVELSLNDADGGSATQTITVTTRAVPRAAANATIVAVTPGSFASAATNAQPGEILLLGDGQYAGFLFPQDGTLAAPIVIRAENPGSAIINGDVRLNGRSHVYLEGLTINGRVRLDNTVGAVVSRCLINATVSGIVSFNNGAEDATICDNVVLGTTTWANATVGANGNNSGEGIEVTGPGSVICYNAVKGFRDGISTLEDSQAVNQISIDIYNNDIEIGADDAIETDFTMGNVRVMRNRITNSFVGISGQPTLGGPIYYIRNVMYNIVYTPFKLHRGSYGDIALHNTVVKSGDAFAVYTGTTWGRAMFRNNLFIGGNGGGTYGGFSNGTGRITQLSAADATCDFDYDGYGSIGTGEFRGRIGAVSYASLAEMQTMTTEANAVQVSMSVFEQNIVFPATGPFPERGIADLRLADPSAAIDRGIALANVNDGFAGVGPDLGAYEAGSLLPPYGPRSAGAVCGNGVREGAEECDDGNTVSGDGCSSLCTLEPSPPGDAGVGGNDGGNNTDGVGGGCGCRVSPRSNSTAIPMLLLLGLVVLYSATRFRRRRA